MPLFRSVDPRGHSACLRASRDAKGLLPSLRFPPRRLRRTLRITSAANAADAADRLVRGVSRPAAESGSPAPSTSNTQGVALSEEDVLKAALDLKQAEIGFRANAATFRTGDKMTGVLIDIFV